MGFDLRYNFINTFRTVDAWRNNNLLNAQGGLLPGFKQRRTQFSLSQATFEFDPGAPATANQGGRAPMQLSAGELTIQRTALQHRQDPLKQADGNKSHLAIQGNGFFAVAESLSPGARVMLTRDGSFTWQVVGKDAAGNPNYQLMNSQGLYVLRAVDIDPKEMKVQALPKRNDAEPNRTGPPGLINGRDSIDKNGVPDRVKGIATFETQQDGKEGLTLPGGDESQLAIIRVPNQSDLNISSFGPTTYGFSLATLAGASVRTVNAWYKEVNPVGASNGIWPVQGNRIEQADAQVALQLATLENQTADFVFKNLSTMLQEYNNSQDQLLNLIR